MENCTKYHLCTALGQFCEGCVNYEPVTVTEKVRPVQVVTKCLPPFRVFKKTYKPICGKRRVNEYVEKMLAKKYWYLEINKKTQK
jgi:effector-binding domain-containing protein